MPSAKPVRSEGASTSERIVVVADLHVSAGGGAPLFTADEAFARFVDNLGTRDQPRISALVLAGDFFDFVHATRGRRAWRDTSEEASLGKLELIADAHPLVVRALDDLAASGTRVVVIPGNHDLEFVRPSAQRRLREVLGASQAGTEDAVDFHPWIVYRRGFLYAEHGSQHHDLNAIRTLLVPSALGLETPLGAHVDLHRLDSAAGARGKAHVRLGAALVSRLLGIGDAARPGQSRDREAALEGVAQETGLDRRTLASLDRLSAVAPLALERRIAREAARALIARFKGAPLSRESYLEHAAAAIDDVLTRDRAEVPFYIFGHTHVPADRPLRPGRETPRYLNPGTWSTIVPRGAREVSDGARFGFIELEGPEEGRPTARLLRWDDERHAAAPV